MLFLPQKPYMMPETLRELLYYPRLPLGHTDAQLHCNACSSGFASLTLPSHGRWQIRHAASA
jgi:hypothetical protein